MIRTILLATDGSQRSEAAVQAAAQLADRLGATVKVVAVAEVPQGTEPGMFGVPSLAEVGKSRLRELRKQVERMLQEAGAEEAGWPVTYLEGHPARKVATHAGEVEADLIVLGLGRRRPMDRLLGHEMAATVVRVSPVPVLAVHPDHMELPRSVVAAVDFSDFSKQALGLLPSVVASQARIVLTHVMDVPLITADDWTSAYRETARDRLSELGRSVSREGDVNVEIQLREGGVVRELLALAHQEEAQLLAMGSHGQSFVSRLLLGSVSRRVLRNAECSVLVVPPTGLWESSRS
ncbi:MAG: universal stress protein [Gemmatimonadota bacterium]